MITKKKEKKKKKKTWERGSSRNHVSTFLYYKIAISLLLLSLHIFPLYKKLRMKPEDYYNSRRVRVDDMKLLR